MNEITNDQKKFEQAAIGLYEVIDPEIGLNVVDLGLIYQIDFDEAAKGIYCTMTLTTQFCPMGESIQTGVVNSLQTSFPEYRINVNIVFDPPWNVSRISEAGLEFLNM